MINPNQIHRVNVGGTELFLSEAYDSMHHYAPLDAHWINYFDSDEGTQRMFVLKEDGARFIMDNTPIPWVERKSVTQGEHDALVGVLSQWVLNGLLDFDVEEPSGVDDPDDIGPGGLSGL